MPEFHVGWSIDLEAENAAEAARKALEIMQDPESTATVFDVDGGSNVVRIDFTEGVEDRRASQLTEGDLYREYGLDEWREIKELDWHGDTALITDTEGVESTYDTDEVVEVIDRGQHA